MTFRAALAFVAASSLAACGGGKGPPTAAEDPFFALKFVNLIATGEAAPTTDASQVDAFSIEMSFERRDGRVFALPTLMAYAGQVAGATSLRNTGTVEDGLRFEACAQSVADGGVALGFHVHVDKLLEPTMESATTSPTPELSSVDVQGTRWIEAGAKGTLARLPSPDGTGPFLVLAKVTKVRVAPPPAGLKPDDFGDAVLARAMKGRTMHLRVTPVAVPRDFEPGTVLDETATPDVMKAVDGRILRDFEVFTCLDGRVRVAGFVGPPGGERGAAGVNGFVASMTDDGVLHVQWRDRMVSVKPTTGRRFVAVAKIEGGGTAGVLVAVDAD